MSRLIHFTMQTCLTLFINYSYKYLQYLANMADVAEENHMLLPYLAKKKNFRSNTFQRFKNTYF